MHSSKRFFSSFCSSLQLVLKLRALLVLYYYRTYSSCFPKKILLFAHHLVLQKGSLKMLVPQEEIKPSFKSTLYRRNSSTKCSHPVLILLSAGSPHPALQKVIYRMLYSSSSTEWTPLQKVLLIVLLYKTRILYSSKHSSLYKRFSSSFRFLILL